MTTKRFTVRAKVTISVTKRVMAESAAEAKDIAESLVAVGLTIGREVDVQKLKDLLLERDDLLVLLFSRRVRAGGQIAQRLKSLPKVKQRRVIRRWLQGVIRDDGRKL